MEKHGRSVAKAISWRATGSVDTFVISWLLTGSGKVAGSIASVEVVTKMVLYYLHERAWTRIPWGRGDRGRAQAADRPEAGAAEGPGLVAMRGARAGEGA